MSTETNWRGMALNDTLLARGLLPLFNPWTARVYLYATPQTRKLADKDLASIWLQLDALSEYLQGIA